MFNTSIKATCPSKAAHHRNASFVPFFIVLVLATLYTKTAKTSLYKRGSTAALRMIVFLSLSKGSLSISCSYSTPAFTPLHDVSGFKIWHILPIFVYDSYIMRSQDRRTPLLPYTFQGRRPLLPPTESRWIKQIQHTWLLELRLKMPPALSFPMKLCQFLSLSCSIGSAQSKEI